MTETKASWVTAKPEEVKAKIIELAKQGTPPEKIGLVLRDQHGIPKAKLLGIKLSTVLKEAKLWQDSEAKNNEKKIDVLNKHIEKNKHDYTAQRSLIKQAAKHNFLKERGK